MKKLTYEEVKNFIEIESKTNYKLVSDIYINNSTKLDIQCEKGHFYKGTFGSFKNGNRCPICSNKIKHSYKEVKNYIEFESGSGCKLLSCNFFNINKKLKIQCKCGRVYERSFFKFKNSKQYYCKQCSYILRSKHVTFSQDKIEKFFLKLGYTLLSLYEHSHQKITLKDCNNYYFYTTYSDLNTGYLPNKFHISNPYTIQNIKLWCILNNKPFELISKVYKGNNKKLQWKCLKENCNEIFETTWNSIYIGHECPFCAGVKVGLSNCLVTKNPELASEWHPTLNGDLTPYDVTCNSSKEVWWQCKEDFNHKWKTLVSTRQQGNGCPFCSGFYPSETYNLLIFNPKLCEEWDYSKNELDPSQYTPFTNKKVWWICKNGHNWKTSINSRNRGIGCPYCSHKKAFYNNNLLIKYPELIVEWNYSKNNKRPEEYLPNSNLKVWWICKECGHSWKSTIQNRKNGSGCPFCNMSKGEKKIKKVLIDNYIQFISQYKYSDCRYKYSLPFDFYLPNYNLVIEMQGIQHYKPIDFAGRGEKWANEQFNLNKIKDQIKRNYCKNNNIKLIEIPYWDFDNIEEILEKEFSIFKKEKALLESKAN